MKQEVEEEREGRDTEGRRDHIGEGEEEDKVEGKGQLCITII